MSPYLDSSCVEKYWWIRDLLDSDPCYQKVLRGFENGEPLTRIH